MLLLHPAQLGITVLVSNALHDVEWEGADLFDGVNGNLVFKSTISSLLKKVVVDLAGAEQDLEVVC